MYGNGSNFFGFTNNSLPTLSQTQFNIDMNLYVGFSGWTGGVFPTVISSVVPQSTGGLDEFNNPIVQYNFKTIVIPANTVGSQSWYTWMIPTGATSGQYQSEIDFNSVGNPNLLNTVNQNPTLYSYYFTYTGSTIPQDTYRIYTTNPNPVFYLNNNDNIYFRGNNTTP